MEVKNLIRACVDELDRPLIRLGLIPFVSSLAAIKNRTPFALIYPSGGVWIHRQRGGAVVDRRVNFQSIQKFSDGTEDVWGWVYSPKPGDTIIDVGAGIGNETLYYSKMVGSTGKVIAIEAHPATFACLKKFCELNRLSNVVPIHVAVGDQEGRVLIEDREEHVSNSIIGTHGGTEVPMKTLDQIVKELAHL